MTRDCRRCGFTLPVESFPARLRGRLQICGDCRAANSAVWRVAVAAADGIVRLRAIDALLYLGHAPAARLIARGATDWPSLGELRVGAPCRSGRVVRGLAAVPSVRALPDGAVAPRAPLWWVSLDADTTALFRMLLRVPEPSRTPVLMPAA